MILRELFNGSTLDDSVSRAAEDAAQLGPEGVEVAGKIDTVLTGRDLSVREVTLRFGQSCPLAGSFPAALQCALHYAEDFGGALRATAAVGGDNAARAAMIGSWLGASLGIQALPARWSESLTAREEIASGVEWLVRRASDEA
jgi:ADP-ribosylglycohydrolase